VPVDPESLLALSQLSAPAEDDATSPAEPDRAVSATALGALVIRARTALHRGAVEVLPESEASRRRTAVLAGGSVAAGLLAGLLVPASAQADPPARAALTVAASSPFTGIPRPASAPAQRAIRPAVVAHPTAVSVVGDPASGRARGVDSEPPLPGQARRSATAAASGVVSPVYRATRPLPARSGTGRRIVYAERAAHLWLVGADGQVLRDYKVTGRVDRPKPGIYHVYSKSPTAVNPGERLTFDLMVRFAYGVTGARIGFHTIPRYYDGRPIQAEKDLGRAIGMGGCVRQSRVDAQWLYAWSRVGDTVVVVH